jgi:putative hydrolase of the HAD superfamily
VDAKLPRAILFDLDDTIVQAYGRPDGAWLAAAETFAKDLLPLAPSALARAIAAHGRTFWADAERHRHWRLQLFTARRKVVEGAMLALAAEGHKVPANEVCWAIADHFSHERERRVCLYPDSLEVVDQLHARGVRLALVTNGAADIQRAKIDRFDLGRRFHHVQIEGEHGFGKPEERAYRHAMEALGVAAHETWMVGDNLEWEVVAPQRLGIHAIWYDPAGLGVPAGSSAKPDRIVRRLSELLADYEPGPTCGSAVPQA